MAENNDAEFNESLRSAVNKINAVNFDELRSTTDVMKDALKRFSQGLAPAKKAVDNAKLAIEEQNLAVRRTKASLGIYSNTLLGMIAIGKEEIVAAKKKTELHRKELAMAESALKIQQGLSDGYRRGLVRIESEIKVREAVLAAMNRQLASMQAETQASFDKTATLQNQRSVLSAEKDATESRVKSIAESIQQLQQEVSANEEIAVQAKIESKRKINTLKYLNDSYTSEISEINKALTVARTKNANGKKLSDAEKSRIAELEAMKTSAQTYRAKNEAAIDAEIENRREITEYGKSLQQKISELSTEYGVLTQRIPEVNSELEKNAETLANESFTRADLKTGMEKLIPLIDKEKSSIETQNKLRQKASEGLDKSTKKEAEYASAVEDLTQKVTTSEAEEFSKKMEVASKAMKDVADKLGGAAKVLNDLVAAIRKTQQQFGITADQAAKLKLDNLVTSFESYTQSVMSLGKKAAVSAAEIEQAQADFQSEFGGVLTSEAAGEVARQAKEMGVSVGDLAKARRVFMTQTMGDTGSAKVAQDKFIGEFQKKGLTSKDAMQAIAQNSELLARNGTRFATSFARAAADAKKIGVDLSKVDQVGDNIIGDFEGFLESQAELGAMGFGFDGNKLAQVAESGDTGALFNELRSQLAATGKDITKLRRSEQLALSGALGMSMEEIQRMAGPNAGSGEETLSPEELQKDSNASLGRLVELANVAGVTLGVIAGLVAVIAKGMVTSAGRSIASKMLSRGTTATQNTIASSTSPMAGKTSGMKPTLGRVGAGIGISAIGGLASVGGEVLKEKGYEKTGAAVSTLGEVAKYAGIGMMFGPVGAAIGGLVGAVIGITNNFTAWKEMGTAAFDGALSAITWLGEKILGIGKWLFDAFMTLNPASMINSLITQGVGGTLSKVGSLFGFGDDVESKPGYGQRTLVTPTHSVALNNNDNIVAYADDLMSNSMGLEFGAKGAFAPQASQAPVTNVNVDFSKLEAKLDALVRTIGSMEVKLDGNKVGQVMVSNDQKAAVSGVFRAQRV